MPTQNLLYKRKFAINDSISIVVPTVGEVLDNEDRYYSLVSVLTAMPVDYMVLLDDAGIDFTSITAFQMFLLMFDSFRKDDTSLIFGDLDLSKFDIAVNEQTGSMVLLDREHDIVIDYRVHSQIASALRRIHHLEKNRRKPGNEEAKKYMLERARAKRKRNMNRTVDSRLEPLIVAMVNTEQFKYNFESTRELSIMQFNESVHQIIKKIDYDNRMYGVYSGTINAKELSQDDLSWFSYK